MDQAFVVVNFFDDNVLTINKTNMGIIEAQLGRLDENQAIDISVLDNWGAYAHGFPCIYKSNGLWHLYLVDEPTDPETVSLEKIKQHANNDLVKVVVKKMNIARLPEKEMLIRYVTGFGNGNELSMQVVSRKVPDDEQERISWAEQKVREKHDFSFLEIRLVEECVLLEG